jgi:hypothetical protein
VEEREMQDRIDYPVLQVNAAKPLRKEKIHAQVAEMVDALG